MSVDCCTADVAAAWAAAANAGSAELSMGPFCATRSNPTHYKWQCQYTHPFNGPFSGTRKVKPIWILLKQETVSGSGISGAICKSTRRSRQITTPAPHHSVFTGWMTSLPPNQQRQSTEGRFETGSGSKMSQHLSSTGNCLSVCVCHKSVFCRNG